MPKLQVFADNAPSQALQQSDSNAEIAQQLEMIGVRFEQWQASQAIEAGASQEDTLTAYQSDIDRLIAADGYQTVDVVSLTADHPQKDAFRQKFLAEHRHSEDEVRFFVAGQGLFSLHLDDKVYEVLCEKGDLISVPANTPHWFDMGPNPNFVAIRLFNNPEGWVANFTGSDIADRFSRLEN
jgi:1,2-dihydroxy-3-keto-5-methylthiopentene dioxygenase